MIQLVSGTLDLEVVFMGHIYRNLKPIPVPKDCYVAKKKNRVHRYYYLNGERKYHIVGYLTDEGLMIPNDVFRTLFPKEWNEAGAGCGKFARPDLWGRTW